MVIKLRVVGNTLQISSTQPQTHAFLGQARALLRLSYSQSGRTYRLLHEHLDKGLEDLRFIRSCLLFQ